MLSDDELPKFMQQSLDDVYERMSQINSQKEFKKLIDIAPAFLFTRTNDFLQAIKSDSIVILVPPDRFYEFDILCYDNKKNRVVVNSMEFKQITKEKFKEIVMDHYPMLATI